MFRREPTSEETPSDAEPIVLIADDECNVSDTLALILNQNGYRATAVHSGEQAIELARICTPDFLLMDVILGGISGVEAATTIRKLHPRCKVILFSGQATAMMPLRDAMLEGYFFELLSKPVKPDEIIRRLMTR